MKLLIVSDIHGSLYYAKKAIEAFHFHHCDTGDLLYHGPRNPLPKEYNPSEVATLLNTYKHNIIACRGNCDSEVDQMVLEFPMRADYQVIPMKAYHIMISHGHIYSPENLPNVESGDVFLFGHIHIPVMCYLDGITILNPGSISLPKEENPHTYGIIESHLFTLYDINHTIIKTFQLKETT